MQKCEKCKVTIRGAKSKCPLCGCTLSGTPERETAGDPVIRSRVSRWSVLRVAAFCFCLLEAAMFLLRYISGGKLFWPLVVMVWAVIGLLDLFVVFYYRHNALKLISWQVYICMILLVIIDRKMAGGYEWSVTWVLPAGFVGLAIVIISVGRGLHLMLTEYIIYLALAVLFSMLQIILIRIGWNPRPLPAVISMTLMAVLGAAGLLFFFRELRTAAFRRLHM